MKSLIFPFILSFTFPFSSGAFSPEAGGKLKSSLESIEKEFPGEIGFYAEDLSDNVKMDFKGNRAWYLSSTTKIPVAVVVLKQVEAGKIKLSQKLTLKDSDYVDGSGKTLNDKPGTRLTVGTLLKRMLEDSDSTATDMLIGLIGERALNSELKEITPGFGPITKIVQVRKDAYGELHPKGAELTNKDFLKLRQSPIDQRTEAFAQMIGISQKDLKLAGVRAAFEKYYETGKNSATLATFSVLLKKISQGEVLNPEHTKLMTQHMTVMTTGDSRLKAALPKNISFAQKTGTQIERVCNVGFLYQSEKKSAPFILAACAERFQDTSDGEAVLKKVGQALTDSGALQRF